MARKQAVAAVELGRSMMSGSSGRWAAERLLSALKEGRSLSPAELRTLDTLRKGEWEYLDEVLIEEGQIQLKGIADLIAGGLTTPVPGAMGRTMFQWEDVTDMNEAEVSLSGVGATEDDRQEYDLGNIPLAITHKDFKINLRQLTASRNRGESIDTTQARVSGRLVAERLEKMLFQGGPTFGSAHIYGYTNHPNRNLVSFSGGLAWTHASKTGEQIFTDALNMVSALKAKRFNGPYWMYVPSLYGTVLSKDYKAASDKTIRQRLLEIEGLEKIQVVDQMPANNVTMNQASKDVVTLLDGEGLQTVQWDLEGGFFVKFKAFCIQIPLIRADAADRCGVAHLS